MTDPTPDALLAFERQWWKFGGGKEQAIRDEFGLGAVRYYQLLRKVVSSPDPEVAQRHAQVIARLRRQMDARRPRRAA